MFFKSDPVRKILNSAKKKRIKELSDDLDNIVFLDFDGVINLDVNNYTGPFENSHLIQNLNNFCIDNKFKIVVISSWRKYSNYKDILYNSGLDKKIDIIGCTDNLEKDRESEVLKYLEDNPYIGRFIILDDKPFQSLRKYQVQTEFEKGFNSEKMNEAINLINKEF